MNSRGQAAFAYRAVNLASAAAAMVMQACTGGSEGDEAMTSITIRDSAGVIIVESEGPIWPSETPWSIAAVPSIEIGSVADGGAYELFSPSHVTLLSDGSIAMATAVPDIRLFSPDGTFQNYVGRRGQGPGEYVDISALRTVGYDSLFIWDARLSRATYYTRDGRIVGLIQVRANGTLYPVFPISTASLVGQVLSTRRTEEITPGFWQNWAALVIIDTRTGEVRDTLLYYMRQQDFRGATYPSVGSEVPMIGIMRYPFARAGHWTYREGRVVVSDNSNSDIRQFDLEGVLRRIMRVESSSAPLSKATVDSAIELVRNSPRAQAQPGFVNAFLEGFQAPTYRPTFEEVFIGDDSYVWVASHDIVAATAGGVPRGSWSVFAPDGRWLGEVKMPQGLQPMHFGSEAVVGVYHDTLGVPFVRLHRIIR